MRGVTGKTWEPSLRSDRLSEQRRSPAHAPTRRELPFAAALGALLLARPAPAAGQSPEGAAAGALASAGSAPGDPSDRSAIARQRALWKEAFEAGDVERIMAFYAPGAQTVAFDILPPLQFVGREAYREEWRRFLGQFDGTVAVEVRDADITCSGDLAFVHGLVRLKGKLKSGRELDLWVRATNGLRKIDGVWLVVHDHVSVPTDLANGSAAMGLAP